MKAILIILGAPFSLLGYSAGFALARFFLGMVYGMENGRFGVRGIIYDKLNIKIGENLE